MTPNHPLRNHAKFKQACDIFKYEPDADITVMTNEEYVQYDHARKQVIEFLTTVSFDYPEFKKPQEKE
jgi:hypothetical protein